MLIDWYGEDGGTARHMAYFYPKSGGLLNQAVTAQGGAPPVSAVVRQPVHKPYVSSMIRGMRFALVTLD